jgi:hypothetical protein
MPADARPHLQTVSSLLFASVVERRQNETEG